MEQLKDSLVEDSRLTNLIKIPLKNKRIDPSCPPWSKVSSDHHKWELEGRKAYTSKVLMFFRPKSWKGGKG